MIGRTVYLSAAYINQQRADLLPGQPHPMDAPMGAHVITGVYDDDLVLTRAYLPGQEIRVPAQGV